MAGSFRISIDPPKGLLRITFSGFLTPALVAEYLVARDEALRQLGCAPNEHVTLCDFSAAVPQSQEVLTLFKLSLDNPTSRSRRIAVVVGSTLARLQVQRIVTRKDSGCFDSVDEAETWLLSAPGTRPPGLAAPPIRA